MSESGQSLPASFGGIAVEVRKAPKAGLMSMPYQGHMLLASVTEEYDHAGPSECDSSDTKTRAMEQGQADRRKSLGSNYLTACRAIPSLQRYRGPHRVDAVEEVLF